MAKAAAERRPRVVLVNRCFVVRPDGRMLIIKRSPTDKNNAGKWEVPGGKVDEGQDLTNAQEREVMEETGLLVRSTHPLVYVHTFVIGTGRYKGFPYVALFSITELVGGTFALSDEHTDHAWATYDELMAHEVTLEVRKAAIVLKTYLTADKGA